MNLIKNPIMVALDVDEDHRALELVRSLGDIVGAVKVGPRLVIRFGQSLVQEIAKQVPVFVDQKFLDIPNTMETSVRAAFEAGATFTTVHAWSGPEALRRMAKVEADLQKVRPFKILVVTILTSFEPGSLPTTNRERPIADQVLALALEAAQCGLTGFVCSPHEVAALKRQIPGGFFVTPGIRWSEGGDNPVPKDDQKRTLSPADAISQGASALVIGRPIVDAPDPRRAAQSALQAIRSNPVL